MFSLFLAVLKPIAYISLPVFILNTFTSSSPKAQYYVRSITYASTMAAVGACSFFVAAGMAFVGEKYNVNYIVARTFYWTASRIMSVEVEVEGEEHLLTKPALLVCNHQSMVDILIIGRIMPKRTSMTAKRSIQYTPLGPFMTLSGAVFVDRGNNAKAVRSLQAAGELIRQQEISIWMYPEGTRHSREEADLLPFKKGPFHLAVQANIPIVPIVTENYWNLYRSGFFGKGVIKVKVLPPVLTTDLSAADVQDLSVRVRDQMLVTLREISASTPPPSGTERGDTQKPSGAAFTSDPVDSRNLNKEEPSQTTFIEESHERSDQGSVSSINTVSEGSKSGFRPGSDNGTETEEDEGMVLVGRPA